MFVTSRQCQDGPKHPKATDASLYALQKRWARWLPKAQPISSRRRNGTFRASEEPKTPNLQGLCHVDEADKIRVGYHCSFMDSDTIRAQMGNVLRAHDRSRFEVIGYAPRYAIDQHDYFDARRETGKLTDKAFAEQIRADGIDILVEMSGFSKGHRFGAMARRCAPVQISYLNHPATSGLESVDYILADDRCSPIDHYSERALLLPGCFFRFDYRGSMTPPVAPPPCLKNGYITFGCYGSWTKLNAPLIATWADVLRAFPTAKLRLQNAGLDKSGNRRWIYNEFTRHGIGVDRLILRGEVSRFDLLKAYSKIDISLDTSPYNGGNTIAESFWMGVPVITQYGERFSSRYGSSIVRAAGYPELIANKIEGMFKPAFRMTPDWLALERAAMRSKGFQLWDSKSLARNLEAAYANVG